MNLRLFTISQDSDVFLPNGYELVQSGVELGDSILFGAHQDNVGENISDRNNEYCELTAQYWVWKNEDADAYGFFHYRRYLNLADDESVTDSEWQIVIENELNEETCEKYKLGETSIFEELLETNDVVVPTKTRVDLLPNKYSSVRDQYHGHPELKVEDIDVLLSLIRRYTPEFYDDAVSVFDGKSSYFCNMFVMKKALMNEYFTWLFYILDLYREEFKKTFGRSKYGLRTPAHLAERLLTIFLQYKRKQGIKVKELEMIFFQKKTYQIRRIDGFVPVVFCVNNKLVDQLLVVVNSIFENSRQTKYHIIILGNSITEKNKSRIRKAVGDSGFACSIIEMSPLISSKIFVVNQHLSVETYFRFFIPQICCNYKKIIYLDVDLIVNSDLNELYKLDIGNNVMAAAIDPDMHGSLLSKGSDDLRKYCESRLNVVSPYLYYQAGVLLIDTEKMRECHSTEEWLDLCSMQFNWMDQDIINRELQGKIFRLSQSWNCLSDCYSRRIQIAQNGTVEVFLDYLKARKNPKIIHYAGAEKPWNNPNMDMADVFWRYAEKSGRSIPLLLQGFEQKQTGQSMSHEIHQRPKKGSLGRELVDKLFPVYSLQRKITLRILPNSIKIFLKNNLYR